MTAQVMQRSDARDNRARILAVARAAFATEGLDVPIREIGCCSNSSGARRRRAGCGRTSS